MSLDIGVRPLVPIDGPAASQMMVPPPPINGSDSQLPMMMMPPGYVLMQVPQMAMPQQAFMPGMQAMSMMQPMMQPMMQQSMNGSFGMDGGDAPRQIIVNFLDPEVTNAELHAAFCNIGPIDSARVIYDKLTSQSKGFGFVYFKYPRDAATAMQCMSGHPIRGRRIKVSLANQRPMYQ